jgi:hypothetical protein
VEEKQAVNIAAEEEQADSIAVEEKQAVSKTVLRSSCQCTV